MIQLLKILFLSISLDSSSTVDTVNIEQRAFDEFISRLDSIEIWNNAHRRYFQRNSSKLYFSGTTELYSAMPFQLNLMCRKPNFIVIDSLNDCKPGKDWWIYPTKGTQKISCNYPFVLIDRTNSSEELNSGDLRLFMSNRYYHNGFFYVKFLIIQDLVRTIWYYKLNKKGSVIDIASTAGVG